MVSHHAQAQMQISRGRNAGRVGLRDSRVRGEYLSQRYLAFSCLFIRPIYLEVCTLEHWGVHYRSGANQILKTLGKAQNSKVMTHHENTRIFLTVSLATVVDAGQQDDDRWKDHTRASRQTTRGEGKGAAGRER
jgi:hypothetical protein